MGFPSQTEGFYQEEFGTAAALLRPYALTNEREYFADCFVYWLTYRDNSKKNGDALQRRTKNIRISFGIGKSKLAAGCIGLPAWLRLFETPHYCYYTVPWPASSIKLTAIRLKSDGCTVCIMTISYNLRIANQ